MKKFLSSWRVGFACASIALLGLALSKYISGTRSASATLESTSRKRDQDRRGYRPDDDDAILRQLQQRLLVQDFSSRAAMQLIEGLFARLDGMDPARRHQLLLEWLRHGDDAKTGLGFVVSRGGTLREWPTLRVALLDYIGRLDDATVKVVARMVLEDVRSSGDEWAMVLRNLGRLKSDAEAKALFASGTSELLTQNSWLMQPSVGVLEAFDCIVDGGFVDALPRLGELLDNQQALGTRRAAFIAIDRLAIVRTGETLRFLAMHPQTLASAAEVRAGVFARADVREPDQRSALERYLSRGDLPSAERSEFAAIFPNHNLTVSYNLLTPPAALGRNEMIARDEAALAQVRAWAQSGRFADWRGAWVEIEARLSRQLLFAR